MAKSHPPRWLIEQRKQSHRKPDTPPKKRFSLDWKFWIGLLIAVIALWLTVEDRPTVSLGPPTDKSNLLSTPVTIVNNGVLPIRDVAFAVFVKHAKVHDGLTMDKNIEGDYEFPTSTLMPGEPVTTSFAKVYSSDISVQYDDIDVALIARFRPTWAPFWNRTRTFRFKTVKTDDGMILRQVPAEDIESEYEHLK